MEAHPLNSDEVDAEVLSQVKNGVLQVFGLEETSLEETYVILAAALQGLDLIIEKQSDTVAIH